MAEHHQVVRRKSVDVTHVMMILEGQKRSSEGYPMIHPLMLALSGPRHLMPSVKAMKNHFVSQSHPRVATGEPAHRVGRQRL